MAMTPMTPPAEFADHRWHWLATEHGPMAASWFPAMQSWDISGHVFRADDGAMVKTVSYLGPAIPPVRE